MPNTYTQIHIQAIFAVKYRQGQIQKAWRGELCKYIAGIIENHGHRPLAVNGVEDHVHTFFGMRPTQSLSDLLREIKGSSSHWINERRLTLGRFEWQSGYSAFSYEKSSVPRIVNYIVNQETHHMKRSFLEEYESLMRDFEIDYNPDYIFRPMC
jgi:REP element-mobilizing transposase RayT